MLKINASLTPISLLKKISRLWDLSAAKIESIEKTCPPGKSSPVFTQNGKYTARGWTDWTRGFQYGSAILQFDATGERKFLDVGREMTIRHMPVHVSHIGVHDHGFNNVSTYGNLLRLMNEGKIKFNQREKDVYELALKVSGAVQAARWSKIADGTGYIYSFNGPHSLFVDTIRSCRSLAVAHALGHVLFGEKDEKISLLDRVIQHSTNTAKYLVFYGDGRDHYDIRGRVAHEGIFNMNDGCFRCPSSQQGYSPFTTWTRGLAWAMLGFAEQLEFHPQPIYLKAARATCDFYIDNTPTDGIPYWDTGAPGLVNLKNYLEKPADPFNEFEPVDSSAAAIAAQGLLRLGRHLKNKKYWLAGLSICETLFDEPYLSTDKKDQGLILHSVYHRPNGWDGQSCMWGDYHARELALHVQRIAKNEKYYTFF